MSDWQRCDFFPPKENLEYFVVLPSKIVFAAEPKWQKLEESQFVCRPGVNIVEWVELISF